MDIPPLRLDAGPLPTLKKKKKSRSTVSQEAPAPVSRRARAGCRRRCGLAGVSASASHGQAGGRHAAIGAAVARVRVQAAITVGTRASR